MPATWLDVIPVWAFLPATAFLVIVMIELGYRLGKYRRNISPDEKEAPVGAMSAAAIGLLAFFLAMTFGFVGGRFDERRLAMLDEVNAIGTCALRSETLPPQIHGEVMRLLREYVKSRIEGMSPETVMAAIRRGEELHKDLWAQAMKAVESDRSTVTALFVSSLNEVIDLHTKRVTLALRSRLPGVVWNALVTATVLSMGILGYLEGLSRSTRSPAIVAVALLFATVISMIVDLDRPGEGHLRLGPQLMIDLSRQLESDGSTP